MRWMRRGGPHRYGPGRVLPRPLSAQSSSISSTQRRPKRHRFLSRPLITAPVWQSHAPVAQPPTHHGSMDTQYGLRSTRRYRASRLSIEGIPFLSARCQPCLRCEPRCFDLVRRHRLRKSLLRRFCGPTQIALNVPRIYHAANLFFHRSRYEVCLAQCIRTELRVRIRLQIPTNTVNLPKKRRQAREPSRMRLDCSPLKTSIQALAAPLDTTPRPNTMLFAPARILPSDTTIIDNTLSRSTMLSCKSLCDCHLTKRWRVSKAHNLH
ncbi:hypothetical protein BDP67DRAFT_524575 [Colletotrichum lupini]|nr:hypothetical protein BDP67DRAFT_524575 [Colletotrichum lupini]